MSLFCLQPSPPRLPPADAILDVEEVSASSPWLSSIPPQRALLIFRDVSQEGQRSRVRHWKLHCPVQEKTQKSWICFQSTSQSTDSCFKHNRGFNDMLHKQMQTVLKEQSNIFGKIVFCLSYSQGCSYTLLFILKPAKSLFKCL